MSDPKKPKGLTPRHLPESRAVFDRLANAKLGGTCSYALARNECGDWYTGPDWAPFNLWQAAEYGHGQENACAKVLCYGAGAEALWGSVAAKYPHPDSVALSLPMVCADARVRWADMPRMTPSEFRAHRERLARHAEQLAVELERFYLPRDPDSYEVSGLLDFAELMNKDELDRLDASIRVATNGIVNRARKSAGLSPLTWGEYNDIGDDARALGYQNERLYRPDYVCTPAREDAKKVYALMLRDHVSHWQNEYEYGGVPTLPDMLRRIAGKFAEDGQDAPIARPNLANAERNFFARAVCKYFWQSKADISPAIVRDIVCMFYPQGMDENEVSQMAASVKAAHAMPSDPETSGPN